MKRLFPLMLLLSIPLFLEAQNTYRRYTTQQVHRKEMLALDDYFERYKIAERYLPKTFPISEEIQTIPVIFHVVYNKAVEQISADQIHSQLEALNRDFSQVVRSIGHASESKEGFAEVQAEDTYIRFCLARFEQAGQTVEGVQYVSSNVESWISDDAIKSSQTGGANAIQPQEYLNVWIGNFGGTSSGYAQLPFGAKVTDGIAIDYRFFGTIGTAQAPYDEGKTLSHLIGSYLGLLELWNEFIPCRDDLIEDTPIHNAPNFGCPNYRHFSVCKGQRIEMSMNLMDNTDDACQYLFTKGQVARMQWMLSENGLRHTLTLGGSACGTGIVPMLEARSESVIDGKFSLELSPNPTDGAVFVKLSGHSRNEQTSLKVFDTTGKIVFERLILLDSAFLLDTTAWSEGVYHVQLQHQQKQYHQKLVLIK